MLLLEMQWKFTAKPPTNQQHKICSTKQHYIFMAILATSPHSYPNQMIQL